MKTVISFKQLIAQVTSVSVSFTTFARAMLCCCVVGGVVLSAYPDSLLAATKGASSLSQKLSKKELKQARIERRQLKKLSLRQLKNKMKKGDRAAGLAIAHQFADEASSLAATPVLANSAAEDAVRWYSLAARKGVLHSKAIVEISVPPIRATRRRHR